MDKKIVGITIVLFRVFCDGSPLAQAQENLTWSQCLVEAQRNNPSLISATAGIKQNEAQKKIIGSANFPQLTGSANARRGEVLEQTSNSFSYGVEGTQLLFDGFKTTNKVKAATENLRAAEQFYRFTSAQVRFNLRSAFINLLRAQELINVAGDITRIRKNNLALINLRYESGLEHKGALLTAEANLAAADFELAQAQRTLAVAQRQLTKEMGRRQFIPMTVSGDFVLRDTQPEKPDFESLAKNHPNLLQLKAQENAAAFGIKSAYADFSPRLSASAGAGKNGSHWPPGSEQWSAGLALNIPFFEGGLRTAQVNQAKAQYNQAQANSQSTSDNLVVNLEQAWVTYQDARETVEVQRKVLLAAEERSKIAEAQYAVGFITYDNWSIIEDNLVQAKKTYLDAQANALVTEARWILAKGETLEYAQ